MVAVGLIASLFFSILITSFKNCVKKNPKAKNKTNKKKITEKIYLNSFK